MLLDIPSNNKDTFIYGVVKVYILLINNNYYAPHLVQIFWAKFGLLFENKCNLVKSVYCNNEQMIKLLLFLIITSFLSSTLASSAELQLEEEPLTQTTEETITITVEHALLGTGQFTPRGVITVNPLLVNSGGGKSDGIKFIQNSLSDAELQRVHVSLSIPFFFLSLLHILTHSSFFSPLSTNIHSPHSLLSLKKYRNLQKMAELIRYEQSHQILPTGC